MSRHARLAHRADPPLSPQQFETVRQPPSTLNGHLPAIPVFESTRRSPTPPPPRPASPLADDAYVVAHEEQSRLEEQHEARAEPRQPSPAPIVNVTVHTPQPPSPPFDQSFATAANVSVVNDAGDLAARLAEAHAEIQRLRALLAATPDPAELRRRTRAVAEETVAASDGDGASDVGTSYEQNVGARQEGASPQQVGIIALMVFIITYLFF